MLKFTEIRIKGTSKFIKNCIDKSDSRLSYFVNVIKSISLIEELLTDFGYSRMFVEQSPFSSSCYFTFNRFEDGNCIESNTIRISDHENTNGFDISLTDEIISRFGFFNINKDYILRLQKHVEKH